ncbi:hypothetical protein [Thiolapillus sp.]|uniref:hypothetical protein n=1 Tax=Thiolapillus sp. TaxID=2017437 RepID=UPI003AF83271
MLGSSGITTASAIATIATIATLTAVTRGLFGGTALTACAAFASYAALTAIAATSAIGAIAGHHRNIAVASVQVINEQAEHGSIAAIRPALPVFANRAISARGTRGSSLFCDTAGGTVAIHAILAIRAVLAIRSRTPDIGLHPLKDDDVGLRFVDRQILYPHDTGFSVDDNPTSRT